MLVERLKVRPTPWLQPEHVNEATPQEPDASLYRPALESMRTLIRTSTSSMTSVPKPLKFLRPHYPELQTIYDGWPSTSTAVKGSKMSDKNRECWMPALPRPRTQSPSVFADILSVLAMTYSDSGKRETLNFRLKGGSDEEPGLWGHEYVRQVAVFGRFNPVLTVISQASGSRDRGGIHGAASNRRQRD
jgi:hypothetical protein